MFIYKVEGWLDERGKRAGEKKCSVTVGECAHSQG